jgi:hypothetical protein
MYRKPPPAEETVDIERRDLVYAPREPEYGAASLPSYAGGFVAMASVIVSAFVADRSPNLAGVVILAGIVVGLVVWILLRRSKGIVFSVVRGQLFVRQRAVVRTTVPLHRLDDVIVDGDPHACIVLLPEEPQRPFALTPKNLARNDCVEWAAKIRAFLRAHGWTPLEERPVPSSSSVDDHPV